MGGAQCSRYSVEKEYLCHAVVYESLFSLMYLNVGGIVQTVHKRELAASQLTAANFK